MKIKLAHSFEDIICIKNLLAAWQEFLPGKRAKPDVQEFGLHLMDNLFALHYELAHHTYNHGSYQAFRINDPKPRKIHKSSVRDRLLHHAVYRILYPFFDRTFISDSFSCRLGKGTHKALNRFRAFQYQVSQNDTRICWVLKCDIKKFFEHINHYILIRILKEHISDQNIMWLLENVIHSFSAAPGRGLPLGNLTSQLLVNIYMNEFDQFAKHALKSKYYIRYADDFVILSHDKTRLEGLLPRIDNFLTERLALTLHPNKISIETVASGIDFLGWVHFSDHRVLRTVTKRRMIRKLQNEFTKESLASYVGLLGYGNAKKILNSLAIMD